MISSKFDLLIKFLENKSVIITSHDVVDLDGFVSCILFKETVGKLVKYNDSTIFFSEFSKNTKDYIERFKLKFPDYKIEFSNNIEISNYDVLVILDTNNLELLQNQNLTIPFIFIDHHIDLQKKYDLNIESLNIIYDKISSTTELIYNIMEEHSFDISLPLKYLIVSAILTDTGFFRYSNNETIKTIAQILNNNIQIQDIFALFSEHEDLSKRIARIKGFQRVKMVRIDDWLIGITHVSNFAAAVATMLINNGFDIGFVYSHEKKDYYKVTTRAKMSVCRETGLHLGNILNQMPNGTGGGHDGAASFNGEINIDDFIEDFLERIKNNLILDSL